MSKLYNKNNVGAIARELMIKAQEDTGNDTTVTDQMRESLTDYEKNVYECIESNKKEMETSFFVVVTTKKERLMENVIRNYFHARRTCPTPQFDQTVYRYDAPSERIDYLWTIPSKPTCEYIRENALQIVPEEKDLRDFVLAFYDGTLDNIAQQLNGEKKDSLLIEN